MSEPDLDELRAQSQPGTRAENTDDSPTLEEEFIKALDEIEDGASNKKTLSVRDTDLAAFVRAIEDDEERLEDVVQKLHDRRGRGENVNRQELILSATWIGLNEVCPEEVVDFQEAKAERARRL